jgi:hypothetical protein
VHVTQVDIPTHPLKASNCHDMGPFASLGGGGPERHRRPRPDDKTRLAFTQQRPQGSVCRRVGPYWPELARWVLAGRDAECLGH